MERCRFCKHWKPDVSFQDEGYFSFADLPNCEAVKAKMGQRWIAENGPIEDEWDQREFDRAITDLEWGECLLTELGSAGPDTLARAIDVSDYMAVLKTHFSFGCVQFEQRMK